MAEHYFCVHGHFYQPQRGNPFADDALSTEPGAEPFKNFNEKATFMCYTPNASLGNFDLMSFNIGSALTRWMELNAPESYARIMAADRKHREQWGVGNALAQPTHHAILPLCNPRDQQLLVKWGLITFEHRFGRPAEGMWLPELGVTLNTLQVLHDNGVKFTILGQAQVEGANEGGGPYWVKLPSGDRIAVFVRNDDLSNQVAFSVHHLGGAGRWARNVLAPLKKSYPRLLLLGIEGETFGYHHPGEEHFLRWLLSYEAVAAGYDVTTLARDLRDHPPTTEIKVLDYTAWNSAQELARWRGDLRDAMDHLANRLDDVYLVTAQSMGVEAWKLREDYIRVRLGQCTPAELFAEHAPRTLTAAQAETLAQLLKAQFHRQRMYTSAAYFYEDLDRAETRLAIADAVVAMRLNQAATNLDLGATFRADLARVVSNQSGRSGAEILDDVLTWERESAGIPATGGESSV
jgi:alpha-amylase/alpha-mannosidase (GH57 family)